MRYTQSKFSQDYKVDERYRGTNNKTRTNPGERPKQIDNNTGIAFLKRFSKGLRTGTSLRNLRPTDFRGTSNARLMDLIEPVLILF